MGIPILPLVDEAGNCLLINLYHKSILHFYKFNHHPLNHVKFSPDGSKFAVTLRNSVALFHAPDQTRELNPFAIHKQLYGFHDEPAFIDWASSSKTLVVASKDMSTKVFNLDPFCVTTLGGHTDAMISCYFNADNLDVYTISSNGSLVWWKCKMTLKELNNNFGKAKKAAEDEMKSDKEKVSTLIYEKAAKYYFSESRSTEAIGRLTASAFHKPSCILVTGFDDGIFCIHDLPDFNHIQTLTLTDSSISTLSFNKAGDWIAIGSETCGQLIVWEWQSETFILKQQGHYNAMTCLAYSPSGEFIVTGGIDSKVKVWNTTTGYCQVTFKEHTSAVTAVNFFQSGRAIFTASYDGTARAFDLSRYRNFRTFTSPEATRFTCADVDSSGELGCAGSDDPYNIFVWSINTGHLLEVLSGHEGPISCVAFTSIPTSGLTLVSGSWDKTIRLWDMFDTNAKDKKSGSYREIITLSQDILSIAVRPDGKELAVATLNCQISFWNTETASPTESGTIEGKYDIGYSRRDRDKITAKKSGESRSFTTLCYSADGESILAGGKSKYVCIYNVASQMVVKRFEVTCNKSLDGVVEFLDRRQMSEFGNKNLIDLGGEESQKLPLPGISPNLGSDFTSRNWKPEMLIHHIRFSPTGRCFAAASTEGLLVYSLDHAVSFDPFELTTDITPTLIEREITEREYGSALIHALSLNEIPILWKTFESIPVNNIEAIIHNLPNRYVELMIKFLGRSYCEKSNCSHIHFILLWVNTLLQYHGSKIKSIINSNKSSGILTDLIGLERILTRKYDELSIVCDNNQYMIDYIIAANKSKKNRGIIDDDMTE